MTLRSISKSFTPIKQQFFNARQNYPNLHYAVVRGEAMEDAKIRGMVCGAIARHQSFTGPSSFTPPYSFFFGTGFSGLPLLRSLSTEIITMVRQFGMCQSFKKDPIEEARGMLPPPFHQTFNRLDLEHDWMDWVRHLGQDGKHPVLGMHHGPITEWKNFRSKKDGRGGTYLFLPNGNPVGRFSDGKGKITEGKNFGELLKAFRKGQIEEISILQHDVFATSTAAIDVLVTRITRGLGRAVGSTRTFKGSSEVDGIKSKIYAILERSGATSPHSRMAAPKIAVAMREFDSGNLKHPLSEMVKDKILDSMGSARGGYWIIGALSVRSAPI